MIIGRTFETTYPCHSFSELVRLSIALGSALKARRELRSRPGRWQQPAAVMSQGPSPTAETFAYHRERRPYPLSY
jgi:hypothetical protein